MQRDHLEGLAYHSSVSARVRLAYFASRALVFFFLASASLFKVFSHTLTGSIVPVTFFLYVFSLFGLGASSGKHIVDLKHDHKTLVAHEGVIRHPLRVKQGLVLAMVSHVISVILSVLAFFASLAGVSSVAELMPQAGKLLFPAINTFPYFLVLSQFLSPLIGFLGVGLAALGLEIASEALIARSSGRYRFVWANIPTVVLHITGLVFFSRFSGGDVFVDATDVHRQFFVMNTLLFLAEGVPLSAALLQREEPGLEPLPAP